MNSSLAHSFDYTAIDDVAVAGEMQAAAGRIRERTRAAVVEVGRDLLDIKKRVEHGQFQAWVETECQINIRTAQRAMAAAAVVEKNDKLSYLPSDGLLALAARSTPAPVADLIVKRIEAGEKPTASEIKGLVHEVHEANRTEARLTRPMRGRSFGKATPAQQARRAKKEALEQKKEERQRAERNAVLDTAVHLLVECLGDRLSDYLLLASKASPWDIHNRLRSLAENR
jgi:hypothetical protein